MKTPVDPSLLLRYSHTVLTFTLAPRTSFFLLLPCCCCVVGSLVRRHDQEAVESMSRFVNGVYAGWLTTKGAKRRLGATIRFSGRALEGAGDVGGVPCTVVGTYSFAPPYGVTISFLSTDGSSIELNGWSEKERGGLFGSGVDAGVSCTFVLDRVGDLPEASPPRAAQDDGEAHVETLVSMG